MTTIDEIKNECLGWTGLQSGNPQGQFAQRAAKALLVTIDALRSLACFSREAQEALETIRRTWEEAK